jgi:hypothetical protein
MNEPAEVVLGARADLPQFRQRRELGRRQAFDHLCGKEGCMGSQSHPQQETGRVIQGV